MNLWNHTLQDKDRWIKKVRIFLSKLKVTGAAELLEETGFDPERPEVLEWPPVKGLKPWGLSRD